MVRQGGDDRHAPLTTLRPVGAAFLVFGVFWGAWAVSAAELEDELGVSHGGFGLLLSVALAGAAFTNAVGGALAERHGTRAVLAAALAAWGGLLAVGAAGARGAALLGAAIVGVVAVGGLVDVVMNVAATAGLGDRPGRFVRFHARFNAGAAVGALTAGIVLGRGAGWRWAWALVGAGALAVAAWCAGSELPAGSAGERVPVTGALARLRRERLLLVAVAFAVAGMVEGGVELWGVLFLRRELASGLLVGTAGAVTAYTVAGLARVLLGPAAGGRGAARGVVLGAGTAAAGLVLVAVAPVAGLAAAGLVLAAGGISLCWPLLLAHASTGRARPGSVIGAVSGVGYLGFVLGPALVGGLAGLAGLRAGLLLLAGAAVFVGAAAAR